MSADTKDPNAYLAREIDLLANDYHALGNRNRSIARDAISSYQARRLNVDDLTETRVTGQHMVFVKDGRKRLETVLSGKKLPLFRRFLRWLKKWSDRT